MPSPPEEVLLRVRVQPKASRNALVVEDDGRIRVALTAPPVEGEANEALKAFLAKTLGVPRRAVSLVQGEKSRDKTVRIRGVTAEHVRRTLGMIKS
jgi:uncharacterized protein (TIGR00251 family)